MLGFCNGLAIVIGNAQLHPFTNPEASAESESARGGSSQAVALDFGTLVLIPCFFSFFGGGRGDKNLA